MTYLSRVIARSSQIISDSPVIARSRPQLDNGRISIYIRSVESGRGAERVAVNVARGLAERGYRVDFLVEEDGDWLTRDLLAQCPDIDVVNLRDVTTGGTGRDHVLRLVALALHLLAAPRNLLASRTAGIGPVAKVLYKHRPPIAALLRHLQTAQPKALLSFLNYPNAVVLLTTRLHRGRTRFVVSVRNHMSVAAANNESRWVRSVPDLMRSLFYRADAVIVPSEGVAADVSAITGLLRERIAVIYNPVFRPELVELAEQPVNHPWLQGDGCPVVMGSGKFKMQKDFPTLLRAFAMVRAERPARLIVLGEGEDEANLRALAHDLGIAGDVDFPGHVRNPFAYYRRASVFVLSSQWEGLPNALIEAMACGCPVVSTDCPSGPEEILQGGAHGPLVPVGSAEAMAAAILDTLANPPARRQLVERARQFSLDVAVPQFEAVLTGVAAPS